ncbi:LysR substrate-binding domain-containing protein, partial [Sinorhizobium meliloti]|uniref:LysR substrate-binding domain-containing protein n=1 Tax=Rhizobium meliloti TaxID=382 RepID=UPI000FE03E4E
ASPVPSRLANKDRFSEQNTSKTLKNRRLWTGTRLARRTGVEWADLAAETFLVRHGGTGPQVHDHIILRLAGGWPPPAIHRFAVERGTLLSMVAQGFGITLLGAASQLSPTVGVLLVPIIDEPDPVVFSAVWWPNNRGAALRNLLTLASKMRRTGTTIGSAFAK